MTFWKGAKKPVSYNNDDDDDDDDEFGDDDSFINDESEDIGGDSDYEPPDSDDSGKEDLKTLKKEAKAFTRSKWTNGLNWTNLPLPVLN